MIELRQYQRQAIDDGKDILKKFGVVYYACEMRTGKGVISLTTCFELGYKRVCFITKKMNIVNAEADKVKCGYPMIVDIFSMDSIHKIVNDYDIYIVDESHAVAGTYPKPSKRAQQVKLLTFIETPKYKARRRPVILMSGTPSAESYSQLYHQFWLSYNGPWKQYTNFYKWAHEFCKQYGYEFKHEDGRIETKFRVKQKFLYGQTLNDYSEAIEDKVKDSIRPYMVNVSQQDAGFKSFVEEEIFLVDIDERLYKLMDILKRDKVYKMKSTGDFIIADTPVRLQQAYHQISSGTIKITDPTDAKKIKRHILDESKAYYIKREFAGHKIAIYYKYVAEGEVLRKVFPNHTMDQHEFNKREDLVFVCQIQSGSMGVDLQTTDWILVYNIDFSATQYWQLRARMQSFSREKPARLGWIFSAKGFEMKIHSVVCNKKDYTLSHFKKDYQVNQAFKNMKLKSGSQVTIYGKTQSEVEAKANIMQLFDEDGSGSETAK